MHGEGASAQVVEQGARDSFVIPALLGGILCAYGVFGLLLYTVYVAIV